MKKISIIVLLTIIFKTSFAQIIYIQNTKLGIKAGFLKTDSAFLQALGDTTKYRYLGATILDSNTGYNYVYKKKGWDRILYVTDTSVFYSKKDTLSVYWGKIKGNIPQQTDLYMSLNEKIRYVDTADGTGKIATKYDLIGYINWNDTSNIIASLFGLSKKVNYLDTMLMLSPYLRKTGLNAVSPLSYNSNTNTYSINKASNNIAGYIDTAKYNEWDRKQNSLGFVPENIANKSSSLIFNSDNLYPTQNAVRDYVASVITGTQILQGSWNASTNTPDITGTTQAGYYWIVNVAGTFSLGGYNSWAIGDWAVKTQSGWTKILNTNSVSSVFGRTGAINATNGDYNTNQVTENTNLYYTNSRARSSISLTNTGNSGNASYNSITGVFNIPNYTAVGIGAVPANSAITGSTFTKITFDSKGLVTGGTNATTSDIAEGTNKYFTDERVASNQNVSDNTLARHNALTLGGSSNGLSLASGQVLTMLQANSLQNGALSMGDWITFNNKQNALSIATQSNGLSLVGNVLTQGLSSGNSTGALSSGDWNAFSNKINWGLPILNTIPKFASGTNMINSSISDSGYNTSVVTGTYKGSVHIYKPNAEGTNTTPLLNLYADNVNNNPVGGNYDIIHWYSQYGPSEGGIFRSGLGGWGTGIYDKNYIAFKISDKFKPTFDLILNSTGLGIGTNSPTEKLDIGGTIKQMNCINGMVKADGTGRLVCATPNVDYVKPVLASPPAIPITCTAGNGLVSVSWNQLNDPYDTLGIQGYTLTNSTLGNYVNLFKPTTNYIFNNLTNGNTYTFKFQAINRNGGGVFSTCNAMPFIPSTNTFLPIEGLTISFNEIAEGNLTIVNNSAALNYSANISPIAVGNVCSYSSTLNIYNSSNQIVQTITINLNQTTTTDTQQVTINGNGIYRVEIIGNYNKTHNCFIDIANSLITLQ